MIFSKTKKQKPAILNYNEDVGKAFDVSKDGVLHVDLSNDAFRNEFIKQLQLLNKSKSS